MDAMTQKMRCAMPLWFFVDGLCALRGSKSSRREPAGRFGNPSTQPGTAMDARKEMRWLGWLCVLRVSMGWM
jgi:hypothetical protein